MSKSLYSRVNMVYFRSYLLFNIVASSAYICIRYDSDSQPFWLKVPVEEKNFSNCLRQNFSIAYVPIIMCFFPLWCKCDISFAKIISKHHCFSNCIQQLISSLCKIKQILTFRKYFKSRLDWLQVPAPGRVPAVEKPWDTR